MDKAEYIKYLSVATSYVEGTAVQATSTMLDLTIRIVFGSYTIEICPREGGQVNTRSITIAAIEHVHYIAVRKVSKETRMKILVIFFAHFLNYVQICTMEAAMLAKYSMSIDGHSYDISKSTDEAFCSTEPPSSRDPRVFMASELDTEDGILHDGQIASREELERRRRMHSANADESFLGEHERDEEGDKPTLDADPARPDFFARVFASPIAARETVKAFLRLQKSDVLTEGSFIRDNESGQYNQARFYLRCQQYQRPKKETASGFNGIEHTEEDVTVTLHTAQKVR